MWAPASPQLVGRYAIYGKIASGGMASVHFGRLEGAAGFSRTVAIKRLHAHLAEDPQFRSTMIDEARLAARIHHPNVVPTLDVVAVDGELLVIMEYVRGESLSRLLRAESAQRRRVPLPIASAIVIGALHGLHAAHEAKSDRGAPLGIVHRDVSPQNILVGVDGVARVIDFGIAKAAGRLQTTSDGAVKGKMAYMAPEQLAAGDERLAVGKVTRATDIYAMGVVLWEALAGRRLFRGESEARLVVQVLTGAQEPPSRYAPDLPADLDALVMMALALDPAHRFDSAEEMAERLLRVVPPAFPTEVGKWVEEVASVALARRGMELAEIESRSDILAAPSPADDRAAPLSGRGRGAASGRGPAAGEDVATVSSQPSSLSVVTPRRAPTDPTGPRRVILASALGGSLLIAAGVGTLLWRGATAPGIAASTTQATVGIVSEAPVARIAASAPSPTPSIVEEPPAAAPAPGRPPQPAASVDRAPPPPSVGVSTPPIAHPAPPARSRPKPRPAPKATAPFRFAQPD
jgi:serine/threonine protein kinase